MFQINGRKNKTKKKKHPKPGVTFLKFNRVRLSCIYISDKLNSFPEIKGPKGCEFK